MTESDWGELTEVEPLTYVTDGTVDVAVRRVDTPKGARLELAVEEPAIRIRLDAVTLECLTWQDAETFRRFLHRGPRTGVPDSVEIRRDPDEEVVPLTSITNEFGHVDVGRSDGAGTEWLQLTAPKLGFTIRLNASALESIVWQDRATFTELIRARLEDPVADP